jgi:uncharacterized membrane protein YidH (DUF202 family)
MSDFFQSNKTALSLPHLAHSLRRLGWIGLGLQGILGFIPILVLIVRVLTRYTQSSPSLGLLLAVICLLALLLAMYWCFHYVGLADKLEKGKLRSAQGTVIRTLGVGLTINIVGMICAVLIAIAKTATLTLNMLRLPQGATIITTQATGNGVTQGSLITPSDMIILQALINTIAAELAGIIIALLLLRKAIQHFFSNIQSEPNSAR